MKEKLLTENMKAKMIKSKKTGTATGEISLYSEKRIITGKRNQKCLSGREKDNKRTNEEVIA